MNSRKGKDLTIRRQQINNPFVRSRKSAWLNYDQNHLRDDVPVKTFRLFMYTKTGTDVRLMYMKTFKVVILENRKRLGIRGIQAPSIDAAESLLQEFLSEYAYPTFAYTPDCVKFYIERNDSERSMKLVIGGKRFSMFIQHVAV